MRNLCFKIIVVLITLLSSRITTAQLTVDAGNDTIFCGTNYQLGGAPTATGGTPPYTYVWETSYTDTAGTTFSADSLLNDSSLANPSLTNWAYGKPLTFKLTVTDALSNVVVDSINITIGHLWADQTLADPVDYISVGDSTLLWHYIVVYGFAPLTYQWSPNYKLSDSTLRRPWAKPDTTTRYYCTTTTVSGCEVQTYFDVYVTPLSVEEEGLNQNMKLYPNPSTNNLIIENLGENKADVVIEVRGIDGKLTLMQKVNNFEKVIVNTAELPAGVYFVAVKEKNKTLTTKKWIKVE